MSGVPTIEGLAVRLRPIAHDEATELLAGRRPAEIDFAPGYPSRFSLEVMDLVAGPRADVEAQGFAPWFVTRREDGAVIGEIGYALEPQTSTATLGYSIVEPSWGNGYATDALRALVAHLRDDAGVQRMTASTLVDHVASRRVMEKAGMRCRGERLGEEDGALVELVVYEL